MAQNGAALALRAVNEQNRHMTCEPETTFFKKRHARYTHFAVGQLVQAIGAGDGGPSPLLGTANPTSPPHTVSTTVHRTADLVGAMFVRTVLPALNTNFILNADAANVPLTPGANVISADASIPLPTSTTYCQLTNGGYCYVDEVGHYLLAEADLYVSGHRIDTVTAEQQYFEWHAERPDEMLMLQSLGIGTQRERLDRAHREQVVYTPLGFWFCKHSSQHFPLVSMSSGEMSLRMAGRAAHDIYGGVAEGLPGVDFDQYDPTRDGRINDALAAAHQDLVYDGVFLDAAEKAMFARVAQEYLITEHQVTVERGVASGAASYAMRRVNMQHPTRDVVFAVRASSRTRPDPLLANIAPDEVYPVRTGSAALEYHTPNQWNNFSGGTHPQTLERTLPLDSLKMQINGFDRFADIDSGLGPFYQEALPSLHYPGRTYGTFGHYYSFGIHGTGPATSGTMNMSALDQIDFLATRLPDPMSTMTAGAPVWDPALTPALYPPPEYQALDVFVLSRPVNVLKIAGGIAGKAYAG